MQGFANVNNSIREFRDATRRMRDRYSRNDALSREDVREVIDHAAKIDNFLSRGGSRNIYRNNNRNLRQQWQDIHADLNILARGSYGKNSNYNPC